MNPVNWFEIPVSDMDRAKSFYEHVLETQIAVNEMGDSLMGWFPMEQGAAGAAGSLLKGEGYIPSREGSVVYFQVADIEGALQRVEEKSGKTIIPKMSIGEHGWIAHFQDSEGNRIALHTAAS